MNELLLDLQAELQELAAIEAESIGWLPLGDGAYLHVGDPRALESDAVVIDIVGVPRIKRTPTLNKKDTHFNCLNKQHSLNSCPWPAPVAPPSRWPTHLSETYADNFESGWISVLFL